MSQIDQISNARIIPLRGHRPICDIEEVDADSGLWRGTAMPFIGYVTDEPKTIYFSRKYDRKNNDFDRIVQEYHITDKSIMGISFWLVPKEKLLFGYEPASTILKPDIGLINKSKFPVRQ